MRPQQAGDPPQVACGREAAERLLAVLALLEPLGGTELDAAHASGICAEVGERELADRRAGGPPCRSGTNGTGSGR